VRAPLFKNVAFARPNEEPKNKSDTFSQKNKVGALRLPLLVLRLLARDASWMGDVFRAANTAPPFSSFTSNTTSKVIEIRYLVKKEKKKKSRDARPYRTLLRLFVWRHGGANCVGYAGIVRLTLCA
jgi:hypothetical protein